MLGMGEDEEEGRRKRELIPLNYSDDEDDSKDEKPKVVEKKEEGTKSGGRLSSREKEKQIREIEDSVPREKDGLFGWKVKWSSLNEVRLIFLSSPLSLTPFVIGCYGTYTQPRFSFSSLSRTSSNDESHLMRTSAS